MKVAAAVILYNPKSDVLENINSYLRQVSFVYVIDNSNLDNKNSLKKYLLSQPTVSYYSNLRNVGIAKALNQAAEFAIRDGFDFLLTMDQDTSIPQNMVQNLISKFNDDKIGIISPYHEHNIKKNKNIDKSPQDVLTVMTCGNLLNLKAYSVVGGFEEKLFIDYVDHEFCLRLNRSGYKVILDNSVSIMHKLGEREIKYFLFKTFHPTNHNPTRLYYRTRNRLWVYKKHGKYYPFYVLSDLVHIFRETISISINEVEKIKKLKMMLLGVHDFLFNRFGELEIKHNSSEFN